MDPKPWRPGFKQIWTNKQSLVILKQPAQGCCWKRVPWISCIEHTAGCCLLRRIAPLDGDPTSPANSWGPYSPHGRYTTSGTDYGQVWWYLRCSRLLGIFYAAATRDLSKAAPADTQRSIDPYESGPLLQFDETIIALAVAVSFRYDLFWWATEFELMRIRTVYRTTGSKLNQLIETQFKEWNLESETNRRIRCLRFAMKCFNAALPSEGRNSAL
jgi:hypothetical protein